MATYTYKKIENRDILFGKTESAEHKYWKSLKLGTVTKLDAPIIAITHGNKRGQYVVADGYRLHLYKTRSDRLARTFGRFKTTVRCCAFRADNELLAASEESGVVRVFNMNNLSVKASLRLFKGHKASVCAVRFLQDGQHLVSGSHDGTFRLWDLPTQTCKSVHSLRHADSGHGTVGEQIRGLDVSHMSPNLVATASFDGLVRLYDLRQAASAGPASALSFGAPLSGVALAPADNLLVASGDRLVRVWAVNRLDRCDPAADLESHHKTVTSLVFGRGGDRLLTAGLDGLVKVHRLSDFSEVHQWEMTSRILSLSLAADDRSLLMGGDDGLLHTRRPHLPEEASHVEEGGDVAGYGLDGLEAETALKEAPLPSAEMERAARAAEEAERPPRSLPATATRREKRRHEALVAAQRQKLRKFVEEPGDTFHPSLGITQLSLSYAKHDKRLRQFRHTDALLAAVTQTVRTRTPEKTLAVLQELIRRRVLKRAIAGQDARSGLGGLLAFIRRNIWRPTYSATLQYVLQCVIEVNGGRGSILRQEPLRGHLLRIEKTIQEELKFAASAEVFKGLFEALQECPPDAT